MVRKSHFELLTFGILVITEKEFGKQDNDGKEAATWANREKDWYNAERRFIFACNTRKERDKWIELIIKDKINKGIKKGM